jgi:hypothetical protein
VTEVLSGSRRFLHHLRRRPRHLAAAGLAVIICAVIAADSGASPTAQALPGRLHIHELHGSVVKLGRYGSSSAGQDLLGVRLRATVCVRSAAEARNSYPSAIGVTHFAVSKKTGRWWPARAVVDRAPWLVPLGETWHGRACGPVGIEDPIPPTPYGVESLGNPNNCYGVALTIKVGAISATKRAIIRCSFGTR